MNEKTSRPLFKLAEDIPPHFDPVCFAYINALLEKSGEKPVAVSRRIREKAAAAISDYKKRYEAACKEIENKVAHTAARYPQDVSHIKGMLAQGDVEGIRKFEKHLKVIHETSPLSELTEELRRFDPVKEERAPDISLDDLLISQEEEMIRSVEKVVPASENVTPKEDKILKTLRFFKDSFSKLNMEQAVSTAISSQPENAGPLNSHLLVSQSLTTIKDVSPQYLNRFISYIDALLFIDQAEVTPVRTAEKKTK